MEVIRGNSWVLVKCATGRSKGGGRALGRNKRRLKLLRAVPESRKERPGNGVEQVRQRER